MFKIPNNEEHSQSTLRRYGVRASELHAWMDEPSKLYGASHRWVRHDIRKLKSDPNYIPKEFIEKYELELAKNIMIDHILLDRHITGERPIIVQQNQVNYLLLILGIVLVIGMLLGWW